MTRLEAYCKALGWHGGTIHQVAEQTKCSPDKLLEGLPTATNLSSDYTKGWFAARTCSVEHNRLINFPKYIGNVDFWLGIADGFTKYPN